MLEVAWLQYVLGNVRCRHNNTLFVWVRDSCRDAICLINWGTVYKIEGILYLAASMKPGPEVTGLPRFARIFVLPRNDCHLNVIPVDKIFEDIDISNIDWHYSRQLAPTKSTLWFLTEFVFEFANQISFFSLKCKLIDLICLVAKFWQSDTRLGVLCNTTSWVKVLLGRGSSIWRP